jgi:FkbM family methyltransferase
LPIAKKWPEAQIVALEPHPENLARLIHNQKLNKIYNVKTLAAAVGGKSGFLGMLTQIENDGGHQVSEGGAELIVSSVSLREVFKYFELERCDLLKIDTEGFDYHVLQSLGKLADPKIIPHIIVECNPVGLKQYGKSAWELVAFGIERGYKCTLLHSGLQIRSEEDIPFIPYCHVFDFLFSV